MAVEGTKAFQLLSSTRYDPYLTTLSWNDDEDGPSAFFLLHLHFQRLVSAAEIHNWTDVRFLLDYRVFKSACLNAVSEQKSCFSTSAVFRIRITVSVEGQITVAATPLPASFASDPTILPTLESLVTDESHQGPPVLKIYVDKEPTTPTLFTRTKTTSRDKYDLAKARNESQRRPAPEGTAWDILLYNQDNQITEATIFNVAFYHSSKWITPSTSTGCLPGVLRRWLLDNGRIIQDTTGHLTKDTLQNGDLVLLFNGVQGIRLGKIYI